MPRNKAGKPLDPTDLNRADGFSPGSALLTKVPDLHTLRAARRTGLPPIGDLSRSLARRSPVVVINARTGKRHPVWAEIDSNPRRAEDRVLIIRPGKNFAEGARYIVALRNLKAARGRSIGAGRSFRIYRPLAQREQARERPPGALRAAVPDAEAGRRRAPQPLHRLGLHGREPPEPDWPGSISATRPSRHSATPTSQT